VTPARQSTTIALIVASAFFMENLDGNIIITALPQMAQSFAVLPTRMSLGVTAYLLAVAATIPASAWVADRLGARNVFCAAIAVFTVASLLCGLAPNFTAFIAARILQGSAAAMMSPVGRLVVLRNAPKSDLMRALSTLVWPALLAPVLGPPLGGFITGALSWRWIFWVNLPLGVVGVALVLLFIPNEKAASRAQFDTRGFLLLGTALGCLTYGIDAIAAGDAGALWLGPALLGLAAVLGTIAWRHIHATPFPVLRLDTLQVKSFFVSSISGGILSRAAISATPFLLPLMFQLGFGLSPVASGLLLLIYMSANLAMKAITNPILRRFGIRDVLVVNGLLAAAGIALCALLSANMPLALSGLILVVAGASRSMQFTALTMLSFADVSAEQRAPASVLFSLTQQIGMGLGVAVGALMLNFSQLLRHGSHVAVFDFRVALVLAGVLCALAVFSYCTLAANAGAEISGHRRGI
jgi:EmrB/QacA subfamily drug resistance transporter